MWSQLLRALKGGLAADGVLARMLTGGFWLHVVPDAAAMPYMAIRPSLNAEADRNTGPTQIDTFGVQFQVWATDPELVSRALARIEGWLLDFGGSASTPIMNRTKIGGDLFEEPERSKDGNLVYQGVLIMELMVNWNPREP